MNPLYTANRRQFLKNMAMIGGFAAAGASLTSCALANFSHGIASGDPLHDRVIIWTRVTPNAPGPVLVEWEVSTDPAFMYIVQHGATFTDETLDYTVKEDVTGLKAGTKYYYRFICVTAVSNIGCTQTLPQGSVEALNFAVFSCSNYPAGYFNVYREAANRADQIDFALHLGDYIYEYAADGYASQDAAALGRVVEPPHEIITLKDYRTRYAQYRTDLDLQYFHEKLPLIAVWDDHEITNDTWREGAENHNEGEGSFRVRKANALRAYYEWMPIREISPKEREIVYRSFEFGDLLSLHMLDTRLIGRDKQLNYSDYFTAEGNFDANRFSDDLTSADRQLLGQEQMEWATRQIQESQSTWQVLGQQVLMTPINLPAPLLFQQISINDYQALVYRAQVDPSSLTAEELAILQAPSIPFNLDAWDGYPAARETILQAANVLGKNLISLAGDTHNAWAGHLVTSDGSLAGVEFATSSVSSPGLEDFLSDIDPGILAGALLQLSNPLQYANTENRGFMMLNLTHQEAVCEWVYIDTVKSELYQVLNERGQRLKVLANSQLGLMPAE